MKNSELRESNYDVPIWLNSVCDFITHNSVFNSGILDLYSSYYLFFIPVRAGGLFSQSRLFLHCFELFTTFAEVLQNRCPWKFCKFHRKTPVLEFLPNQSSACYFSDKSLWHACFFVNFLRRLSTPFLQNTFGFLLYIWNISVISKNLMLISSLLRHLYIHVNVRISCISSLLIM